jgi:hypothetical protein
MARFGGAMVGLLVRVVPNNTSKKLKDGRCLALSCQNLKGRHNNLTKVGVCGRSRIREEAWPGLSAGGASYTIKSGNNFNNNKKITNKYNLALDGYQGMMVNTTTNQKIRAWRRRTLRGGLTGVDPVGDVMPLFRGQH